MEDNLVDSTGSPGCKVFGKDEVFIGFDVFPILHDYLLIKKKALMRKEEHQGLWIYYRVESVEATSCDFDVSMDAPAS